MVIVASDCSNRVDDDNENLDLDEAEEVVVIELITFVSTLLNGLGMVEMYLSLLLLWHPGNTINRNRQKRCNFDFPKI